MDELDYTETLTRFRTWVEIPLVILSLFAGAAFLTKMCYLSLAFNTIFVVVFLGIFTDLQWDLCGIIVGTLFSCIMLRDTRDQLVPH